MHSAELKKMMRMDRMRMSFVMSRILSVLRRGGSQVELLLTGHFKVIQVLDVVYKVIIS